MTCSQLAQALETIEAEYGDIEVAKQNTDEGPYSVAMASIEQDSAKPGIIDVRVLLGKKVLVL